MAIGGLGFGVYTAVDLALVVDVLPDRDNSRWAAWVDGLTLTRDSEGTTLIHGPVVDQAAPYGLLAKVPTSACR